MLSAIGSIITVVAVFESHIDSAAVASMNPSTTRRGLSPMVLTISRAIRRCSPLRSTARAMRNPPRNRKISLLPNWAATSLLGMMLQSGKATNGTSAVAASGSASVIHHTAINSVMAAMAPSCGRAGSRAKPNCCATNSPIASSKPRGNPIRAASERSVCWLASDKVCCSVTAIAKSSA